MKTIEKLLLFLSRQKALALGRTLGGWGYYVFRKRRQLALKNLSFALGNHYNEEQRKKIIFRVFQNLGITFVEFFRFSEVNEENLSNFVTIHGREILEEVYAQKKGVLVLTAHIGNWEFLINTIGLSGFKAAVISKSARQAIVNDYILSNRRIDNITFLMGKQITKNILKHLKLGEIIGIVLDQHGVKSESVPTQFFGRSADTLKSLAVFALRTGAPVLPMYTYRDENDHHHVVIEPVISLLKNDTIESCTLKYNQWLESAIKKHPDQWIWTHNRWKTDE
jgi:KDO2-lipid IV(A) lauroyltransferase